MPQTLPEIQSMVARALAAQWTVRTPFRDINLFGSRFDIEMIAKQVQEYIMDHPDYEFVGMPHFAKSRKHLCIDTPHPTFWKDSATANWEYSITGPATFDNIFPDAASYNLRLDSPPYHRAYLAGLIELGSLNTMRRGYIYDFNGSKQSYFGCQNQARMGASPREFRFDPALLLKERGTINIDIEGDIAGTTEIMPLAVHILPQEIAATAELNSYVTEVAV
jgi:hypothetical protein